MKRENGLTGLKLSFEDEGASLENAKDLLLECARTSIKCTAKIGGCEAKTDIINCSLLEVDNIVAPMVETPYALQKFKGVARDVLGKNIEDFNFYINIETKTAIENFQQILEINEGFLKGVVFGRTDIVGSLGIEKRLVDSEDVFKMVQDCLIVAKDKDLVTAMGGNLSVNSSHFVERLYEQKILDKIETRLAVCSLSKDNIGNISNFVNNAIALEKMVLQKRIDKSDLQNKAWKERILSIQERTSFVEEVNEKEKNTLAIDFDNVIHETDKGFHDGTIYGKPLKNTKESLELLSKKYRLVIHSCKCNPERPLIDGKTGTDLIKEWLKKNDLLKYIDEITFGKTNAIAYIDDKAINFTDWDSCIKALKEKGILE
jgi:hypothetical protein